MKQLLSGNRGGQPAGAVTGASGAATSAAATMTLNMMSPCLIRGGRARIGQTMRSASTGASVLRGSGSPPHGMARGP